MSIHIWIICLDARIFMLQFLKYAEDMSSQVFAELPTSTVVADTSLVEETLLVELYLAANVSETWHATLHFINLLIFKQSI